MYKISIVFFIYLRTSFSKIGLFLLDWLLFEINHCDENAIDLIAKQECNTTNSDSVGTRKDTFESRTQIHSNFWTKSKSPEARLYSMFFIYIDHIRLNDYKE